jgi:GT2 family glycosyltransferase
MVGIVVVNFNTWKLSIECVNSIRETCSILYKIYIVDNHSSNDSYEKLKNEYECSDDVVVLQSGENGGYGYGLNFGMKRALSDNCRFIIASNNDIIYLDNSIELLRAKLNSDKSIAIVAAQQLDMNNNRMTSAIMTKDSKAKILFTYLPLYHYLNKKERNIERDLLNTIEDIDVFSPNGGCYMFRSTVLEKIGFYDEKIFLYAEENIIGSKISNINMRIVLSPNSQVLHVHKQTTGSNKALQQIRSAVSLLHYGKHYHNFNNADTILFKILFRTNFFAKSIIHKEYRKELKKVNDCFNLKCCN